MLDDVYYIVGVVGIDGDGLVLFYEICYGY